MEEGSFPYKLRTSIKKVIDEKAADEVVGEGENREDLKAKAAWSQGAMARLDEAVPDKAARWEIMKGCSCRCFEEVVDSLREAYKKNPDVDHLLEVMYKNPFYVPPVREGDIVYITKAPRRPEEFAGAKTPEERRLYFCHCDYARAAEGVMSPTYCFCGAGWCQHIWEYVLERPIKVEIVSSVLRGDDCCRFAVHLPADVVKG